MPNNPIEKQRRDAPFRYSLCFAVLHRGVSKIYNIEFFRSPYSGHNDMYQSFRIHSQYGSPHLHTIDTEYPSISS